MMKSDLERYINGCVLRAETLVAQGTAAEQRAFADTLAAEQHEIASALLVLQGQLNAAAFGR